MQSRLLWRHLHRQFELGDGFLVAICLRVRLAQHLVDAQGVVIELEHCVIGSVRHQKVGAPAMIENVDVGGIQRESFVERGDGCLRVVLRQQANAEPHESLGVAMDRAGFRAAGWLQRP